MPMNKILLISADDSMTASITSSLSEAGFKAIHSARGKGALDLIQDEQPDAVILDIDLPDYNSLAIIRALRSDNPGSQLPIVLFGSNMKEADVLIGLEIGADLCLREAFHPPVFIARLRSLLRRYGTISYHQL